MREEAGKRRFTLSKTINFVFVGKEFLHSADRFSFGRLNLFWVNTNHRIDIRWESYAECIAFGRPTELNQHVCILFDRWDCSAQKMMRISDGFLPSIFCRWFYAAIHDIQSISLAKSVISSPTELIISSLNTFARFNLIKLCANIYKRLWFHCIPLSTTKCKLRYSVDIKTDRISTGARTRTRTTSDTMSFHCERNECFAVRQKGRRPDKYAHFYQYCQCWSTSDALRVYFHLIWS